MWSPRFRNQNGKVLARKVLVCDRLLSRCRGLLFRPDFPEGEACWLVPCRSVHTWGMGFPLDILALDREHRVVARVQGLKPWRLSPYFGKAYSILEFRSPMPVGCAVGEKLILEDGAR
ncbi:MAG: DUF192 domain-containing protein [Candidatus Omnitrophica bacterium]|nr:DUF192 domain-containing protein [Candidatus Omnitrophota bacterium]